MVLWSVLCPVRAGTREEGEVVRSFLVLVYRAVGFSSLLLAPL